MSRVLVGLSGGVDSAVAALCLLEQGAEVEAVFMKNWEEDDSDGHCAAAEDLSSARAVADHLRIPLHTVNFSSDYWEQVFTHFLAEYRAGRTPNPDILCNREIKFRAFLDYAMARGAGHIATGHYARRVPGPDGWRLLTGLDPNKDQSYFLHLLDQQQLEHSLFPIGQLPKALVRARAQAAGLPNSARRDSTGICFIGERRFRDFLQRYLPARPGEIISVDGEPLGRHQGLMYYTIGQRQGLGIGGHHQGNGRPWYVVGKSLANRQLIVVQGDDHPALLRAALRTGPAHWIAGTAPPLPLDCEARIRYRQASQPCRVQPWAGGLRVEFQRPQRAVAPGQSVVFYLGEHCLGGAVIEAALDGYDPALAPDRSPA